MSPKQAFYKIVIMNRNNPQLELKGITLSWIQQNLYFIALRSGERYSLCMGNPRVKGPDYDIVSFVNQNTLVAPSLRANGTCIAEPEGWSAAYARRTRRRHGKNILKIVVVLLVLGMGFWLYTLLKKTPGKK